MAGLEWDELQGPLHPNHSRILSLSIPTAGLHLHPNPAPIPSGPSLTSRCSPRLRRAPGARAGPSQAGFNKSGIHPRSPGSSARRSPGKHQESPGSTGNHREGTGRGHERPAAARSPGEPRGMGRSLCRSVPNPCPEPGPAAPRWIHATSLGLFLDPSLDKSGQTSTVPEENTSGGSKTPKIWPKESLCPRHSSLEAPFPRKSHNPLPSSPPLAQG